MLEDASNPLDLYAISLRFVLQYCAYLLAMLSCTLSRCMHDAHCSSVGRSVQGLVVTAYCDEHTSLLLAMAMLPSMSSNIDQLFQCLTGGVSYSDGAEIAPLRCTALIARLTAASFSFLPQPYTHSIWQALYLLMTPQQSSDRALRKLQL